jgi:uncharacterized protein YacL
MGNILDSIPIVSQMKWMIEQLKDNPSQLAKENWKSIIIAFIPILLSIYNISMGNSMLVSFITVIITGILIVLFYSVKCSQVNTDAKNSTPPQPIRKFDFQKAITASLPILSVLIFYVILGHIPNIFFRIIGNVLGFIIVPVLIFNLSIIEENKQEYCNV